VIPRPTPLTSRSCGPRRPSGENSPRVGTTRPARFHLGSKSPAGGRRGGESLRRELAISFVLHRIHGIGSPRDFIRFSRCQFCCRPNRSGFKRMCARGRGETAINANHSSGVVTKKKWFSLKSVTFLLKWFVMMIEVPKRSFYVFISTEERTLRENWKIEASRTIAGALTRPARRCHVASGGRKSIPHFTGRSRGRIYRRP
jgi:hypothetical protein